jgi:hypothetical protein
MNWPKPLFAKNLIKAGVAKNAKIAEIAPESKIAFMLGPPPPR